jgi:hypothetical protein
MINSIALNSESKKFFFYFEYSPPFFIYLKPFNLFFSFFFLPFIWFQSPDQLSDPRDRGNNKESNCFVLVGFIFKWLQHPGPKRIIPNKRC